MIFKIAIPYHKDQERQARIVAGYYKDLGYIVDLEECDYVKVPEAECRNSFFDKTSDYIIYLDSDEIVLKDDLKRLIDRALIAQKEAFKAHIIDYMGKDTILSEKRVHYPIIAVKNRVKYNIPIKFKYARNTTITYDGEVIDIDIHHIPFVNFDWKLKNYKERKDLHEFGQVKSLMAQTRKQCDTPKDVLRVIEKILADK